MRRVLAPVLALVAAVLFQASTAAAAPEPHAKPAPATHAKPTKHHGKRAPKARPHAKPAKHRAVKPVKAHAARKRHEGGVAKHGQPAHRAHGKNH